MGIASGLALMVGAAVVLGGCSAADPYAREGMWQPTGANYLNLATMVANPADLQRGRGTVGTPGQEAVPPVSRYLSGKPIPLPNTSSQASSLGQQRSEAGSTAGTTGAN